MRGILFKPDLIEAIRSNRKTVTRRLLKPGKPNPWGKVKAGERLYVKEGLRVGGELHRPMAHYTSDGAPSGHHWRLDWCRSHLSPLHMPASCARLFLTVTADPTVERLLDITEEDARAEGVIEVRDPGPHRPMWTWPGVGFTAMSARDSFMARWSDIRVGPCERHDPMRHPNCDVCNPLVAVVRFKMEAP
jgi:hypothetical protein